jgi:hypothetical protein
MSSYLNDVSVLLYDICQPVWCLLSFVISVICLMSSLYNFCSPIWCLLTCMMSAQLYVVCSAIWWLPICMMSPLRYNVSLPNCVMSACLPPSMMSTYLYGVCLAVWCLSNYAMIALLYVCLLRCIQVVWCLRVWCLPTRKMSCQWRRGIFLSFSWRSNALQRLNWATIVFLD